MKTKVLGLLLGLSLIAPAAAAPTPVEATQPAVPVVASAGAWATAYTFKPAADLKRIRVGNQAGILKVMARDNKKEAVFRGIDDRGIAWITTKQRAQMFTELGVPVTELGRAAAAVMDGYAKLSKKEALAFLGAVGSEPGLDPAVKARLEAFLVGKMLAEKDVVLRRQATLALALVDRPAPGTVDSVLKQFEKSENLWETFPVQMFFEFHGHEIRAMSSFQAIRNRVAGVNSLYTPYILGYLDKGARPNKS